MEKYKAIPPGYMTVGEIAKKMNVTVRTLQYYDKQGLLSPSSESEGGRRLYTHKDMVKLHQILSMKHLGFSLDDIKNNLIMLDNPSDFVLALTKQTDAIQEKLKMLSESLKEIEALKMEAMQMQQVDFKKYADIIINLQMKNDFYWLIKHIDDSTLEHFRHKFDKDSGTAMIETFNNLYAEAIRLKKDDISPKSEKGQQFAKAFWDMILEFTNGDLSMLSKLMESANVGTPNDDWNHKLTLANSFIEPALEFYFDSMGYDPLKETPV